MENEKIEEYARWFLQKYLDSYYYVEEEKGLIKAILESNIESNHKLEFHRLLMNYSTEQIRVDNLQKRLQLQYNGTGLESYLKKVVSWSPKLGTIEIQAGESGQDEENDGSLYFSLKVKEEDALALEERIRRVINIILEDAKKMRIVGL